MQYSSVIAKFVIICTINYTYPSLLIEIQSDKDSDGHGAVSPDTVIPSTIILKVYTQLNNKVTNNTKVITPIPAIFDQPCRTWRSLLQTQF